MIFRRTKMSFLVFCALFFCFCQSAFCREQPADIPVILPRSSWFSDDLKNLSSWTPCRSAFPPDYRKVERIIIHHSAGSNSIPNPAATIQGIYRYHAVTRGWLDIGYNYIIDREGIIYEGRMGGNGVRGAHVYANDNCLNFNHGSIGIVLLGTYTNEEPPAEMYESAARLVGWLSAVNNLNPSKSAYHSFVWQDNKNSNGTCDNSAGGFSYNYYGPVVIGHKDAGNTECPGLVNLNKIRQESGEYAKQFQISNLKFKIMGENEIYEIKDGYAQTISNDQFSTKDSMNITNISRTQLDLFSGKDYYRYPDGSLLKFYEDIYLIEKGALRKFESHDIASRLGFNVSESIPLPISDKDLYLAGNPIKYGPDGKLLESSGTVYFIEKGRKRPFTSASLFESLGYGWKSIEKVEQPNISSYLSGDFIRYKEGALLSVGLTVYVLENNIRRGITSANLFETLKYNWKNIIKLADAEKEIYPEGEIKRYPDNTLARAENDLTVYIIEYGKKRPFFSAEEFLNSGKKWKDVIVLKTDELSKYSLAVNSNLAQKQEIANPKSEIRNPNIEVSNDKLASLIIPEKKNQEETKKQENKETDGGQPPNSSYQLPDTVKVALKSFSKNVGITSAGGGFAVKNLDGNTIYNGGEGDIYIVSYSKDADLFFSGADNSSLIKIHSIDDAAIGAEHPFHSGYGGASDNIFQGGLRVKYSPVSKTCWVINDLSIEDYVKGAAEISEDLPKEYLKAMSVIIRTYAVYYVSKGGKRAGEPFDIKNSLNGNGDDQVYKGFGFARRAPIFSHLSDETRGQIIMYNNAPILAAYSSDSGGISKDARQIWRAQNGQIQNAFDDKPYLWGGSKDPDSTIHDAYSVSISHGSGLSAAGAKEMARLGSGYIAIIKNYYSGADVKLVK